MAPRDYQGDSDQVVRVIQSLIVNDVNLANAMIANLRLATDLSAQQYRS